MNDPIGAMMAVLIFEINLAEDFTNMDGSSALFIVTTIVDSSFFGALGAGILYIMLKNIGFQIFCRIPLL